MFFGSSLVVREYNSQLMRHMTQYSRFFFFFDVLNNGTVHNMLIIDHFYIIY